MCLSELAISFLLLCFFILILCSAGQGFARAFQFIEYLQLDEVRKLVLQLHHGSTCLRLDGDPSGKPCLACSDSTEEERGSQRPRPGIHPNHEK